MASTELLAEIANGRPAIALVDDDGVRHRLWVVPSEGTTDAPGDGPAERLAAAAGREPITIADGHHRYETALRYRDERRMSRACEEDPPFDYVLMLFLETTGGALTVLPTHRVIRDLGEAGVEALWAGVGELFDGRAGRPVGRPRGALRGRPALTQGGRGRFGLWTRSGGALLTARREAFEPWLPAGGEALRGLDVTLLQVALERLSGIDPAATAAGGRVVYTKSAAEAIGWVDRLGGRRRRRVPAGADAGRRDRRGRRRRRRDAPEVDLLLSQAGDRPGHQPARVVTTSARLARTPEPATSRGVACPT